METFLTMIVVLLFYISVILTILFLVISWTIFDIKKSLQTLCDGLSLDDG